MIFAGLYIVRSRDLSRFQRWVIAGIIGGGLGNMIDRIIRPEGVVDFILVNMYGFLGQQYIPVFNLADSCITVCGILLVGSLLFNRKESSPAVGEDAG
jgi:signal peptidase II